jgi:hypothetical protein
MMSSGKHTATQFRLRWRLSGQVNTFLRSFSFSTFNPRTSYCFAISRYRERSLLFTYSTMAYAASSGLIFRRTSVRRPCGICEPELRFQARGKTILKCSHPLGDQLSPLQPLSALTAFRLCCRCPTWGGKGGYCHSSDVLSTGYLTVDICGGIECSRSQLHEVFQKRWHIPRFADGEWYLVFRHSPVFAGYTVALSYLGVHSAPQSSGLC